MVIEKSSKRSDRVNELREHAMELREFEDPDWESTQEDLELLWNLKEALSRSAEKGAVDAPELSKSVPGIGSLMNLMSFLTEMWNCCSLS